MAEPNVIAPLVTALEAAGATLLASDKAALEAFVEPLADSDANAIVSALAAHVQLNGIAGMVAPAVRNALTGSEPAIDGIINQNVNGGFDSLEMLLDGLAKGATPAA
jgi:hypothetical protein